MSLLNVRNLRTHFHTEEGTVKAVDGVDLDIRPGEIVGLVGESGSGKSVTARSIMQLIEPPGEIVDGDIEFKGDSLRALSGERIRRLRGKELSMVFQDPMSAFNPTQTVGRQLHDVLRTHREGPVSITNRLLGRDHSPEFREEVVEALDAVGIPSPEERYGDYPHEFSGGMLQRAMVAMATICDPDLILADEPTTALDVTIERQILSLFRDLVDNRDAAALWITHDLSVVAALCDRVIVMYTGKVMESGPVEEVLSNPRHPYTEELLESVPRYDEPDDELHAIEGSVPMPTDLPPGCVFADRCPEAHDRCREAHPPMYANVGPDGDHRAACYLLEEER